MLKQARSIITLLLMALLASCALTSCDDAGKAQGVGWRSPAKADAMPPGFDGFIERWNKRNRLWLEDQIGKRNEDIKKKRNLFFTTNDQKQKQALEKELAEETRTLEMMRTRLKEGDYIKILTVQDIPAGLEWQDGMDNPEIGDPHAKKGGTIRTYVPSSYPSTFRSFGPNSNNGFRGRLYDEIEMGLVNLHPVTGEIIPAIAKQWAIAPDQRTIFFRIDEDASYSDGIKIKAMDFIVDMFVKTSDYSQSPFHSTVFQENASHITIYDDRTLSITLPTPKPLTPYYTTLFTPEPPHFYTEFGPNFLERYQWRVPPTTGAYVVDPDSVTRGRMVVMTRVKDWWARDRKFYRNRFNVDNIVYNFIADESKALELFRIGELDVFLMIKPDIWHDRMEIPEVHDGYIQRATFYTIYPRVPTGIFLNTAKPPFNDKDVRLGFQHSLNIQKVIDVIYRGDYQRLGSYASGYGRFTDSSIKARGYSPEKAREYFAKAGYTITCPDGILRKEDGTRLTVELTFPNSSPLLATTMSQLKEDARKCGVDLQLDSLDSTVSFRKVMEKRHQSTLWGWGFTPPHPTMYQSFFSGYAYDSKGNVIPYTNNINSYSNPAMDKLLIDERDAHNEEELETTSHAIQKMIHDEALWVPGWTVEFTRIGFWRWVKWPNSDTTRFSYPLIFEPMENYLYWIDEDEKKETLEAKHNNLIFPEVDVIYDQYRFREAPEPGSGNDSRLPSVPLLVPSSSSQTTQPETAEKPEQ